MGNFRLITSISFQFRELKTPTTYVSSPVRLQDILEMLPLIPLYKVSIYLEDIRIQERIITLNAVQAGWSVSEGEYLWRIDTFLFFFQQRNAHFEEDCYFNVVWFCFISVWILFILLWFGQHMIGSNWTGSISKSDCLSLWRKQDGIHLTEFCI